MDNSSSTSRTSLEKRREIDQRQPIFPRWPESNDEYEYCEVPPGHFLAQQGKAVSRLYPESLYDYAYLDSQQAAQPGPSTINTPRDDTPSTNSPLQAAESVASSQPLSELARFMASQRGPSNRATVTAIPEGMPDTSTLAGADFDIDVRTGFLPPEPPLDRLPSHLPEYQWEHMLQQARIVGLKINGGGLTVNDAERGRSRRWRRAMRELTPVTPSHKLRTDIRYARRGHVVLTFLAHFYINSQPQATLLTADDNSQGKDSQSDKTSSMSTKRGWLSSLWTSKRGDTMPDEQLDQDARDARDELYGKYAARLPASISVPLLLLSSQLDIPPILTYADGVLWNWRFKDPSEGLTASNLEIVETFSGTPSEHHFFLTSLLIELRGVAALDMMRVCLDECFLGDSVAKRRVAHYLDRLVEIIADLEQILKDVRKGCDPPTFYWAIRPWFRGGDASPHEVKGWVYPANDFEESLPSDRLVPRVFTGPSAGQSSLIHALDVFFDVDHAGVKARASRPPRRTVAADGQVNLDASDLPEDATFMQRMQLYMPGQHRRFLSHLQSLKPSGGHEEISNASVLDQESEQSVAVEQTPLRHLASRVLRTHPSHPLPRSYDAALNALRSLRDEHMRVATLYIVSQARSQPPAQYAALSANFVGQTLEPGATEAGKAKSTEASINKKRVVEEVQDEAQSAEAGAGAKGTGGTNLVQFLKACRTNTVETLLVQAQSQHQDPTGSREGAAAVVEKIDEALSPRSSKKSRRE